nr:aminotransferase class V-fold PLP-dependent enzyme [Streptomyces sp. HYC2]
MTSRCGGKEPLRSALYIHGGLRITAQQTGGLRADTPKVPAIVGFGVAAHLITTDAVPPPPCIRALRDRPQDRPLTAIPGDPRRQRQRSSTPATARKPQPHPSRHRGHHLLDRLSGIAASTGSACNTGSGEPSHVLTAIGLTREQARATLRLSLGRTTTATDVDQAADLITRTAQNLAPVPANAARPTRTGCPCGTILQNPPGRPRPSPGRRPRRVDDAFSLNQVIRALKESPSSQSGAGTVLLSRKPRWTADLGQVAGAKPCPERTAPTPGPGSLSAGPWRACGGKVARYSPRAAAE